MSSWSWEQELIKGIISAASGLVLLALTWLIGQRLTFQWNMRQKRREMQMSALQQFYLAYGEFFAIWKIWNRLDQNSGTISDRRWELLKRSAAAEAIIEGTFVKLSLELKLVEEEMIKLGRFRQSFQQLRQSIRDSVILPWPDSECPEYLTFKTLAIYMAALLNSDWREGQPSRLAATENLLLVTSNKWERDWILPEFQMKSGSNTQKTMP